VAKSEVPMSKGRLHYGHHIYSLRQGLLGFADVRLDLIFLNTSSPCIKIL